MWEEISVLNGEEAQRPVPGTVRSVPATGLGCTEGLAQGAERVTDRPSSATERVHGNVGSELRPVYWIYLTWARCPGSLGGCVLDTSAVLDAAAGAPDSLFPLW